MSKDQYKFCTPIKRYFDSVQSINKEEVQDTISSCEPIRVVELFAGVGGFRIGLEQASSRYQVVWSNQWEPSTKKQDASMIYSRNFGEENHSNEDINLVPTNRIPKCDLLVGGFPCQDYSVATTLKRSSGIEGKKGVLWWQIYRILTECEEKPKYVFFENVDRLLVSPAKQRGRDFAIILSSLNSLGYDVEWRVINAADYGMPQRRKRTYIVGYLREENNYKNPIDPVEILLEEGVFAKAFESEKITGISDFQLSNSLLDISENFNKDNKGRFFNDAGFMSNGHVWTVKMEPQYEGLRITLGDVLLPEEEVPSEFFINDDDLEKWKYQKGSKSLKRTNSEGYEYLYKEGAMAFPDDTDRPSRTIITGEGGGSPSRFKHVVKTKSGNHRRLTPIELERLNMFPDNCTEGSTDVRRAFLMGNALVTGVIYRVGLSLLNRESKNK